MNIRYILISSLVFGSLTPLLTTAIDQTTSGRILDTFKDKHYTILFDTLPFSQSGSDELLEYEYRINGLE